MSLNRNEVNALGILGLRKLSNIPVHFAKTNVDMQVNTKLIERWIEHNLNSRYAMHKKYKLDSKRKLIFITEIGLEDPNEMTMLRLGCQFLYKTEEI